MAVRERERAAVGSLEVDVGAYAVTIGGRRIPARRTEVELLAVLVSNRHRVISREELAARVGLAHGRSIDVLLSRLRRTIGRPFVRNVRNRGWILDPAAFEA